MIKSGHCLSVFVAIESLVDGLKNRHFETSDADSDFTTFVGDNEKVEIGI